MEKNIITEEAFASACEAYSDKHRFGILSEETLRNCFEIPSTGVKVKYGYFEDTYYPVIKSNCFDCLATSKIGHYCFHCGRVVFVYRNGKTYVAKGYAILKELRAAGYREKGLLVPFSNNEEIEDPVLRKRWEEITK